MERWMLWFLLTFLLQCCCPDAKVTLVKRIGSKPDVTPLCTSETTNFITMMSCKIRGGGKVCHLNYDIKHGLESNCSSRFRLMTENQTVFLQSTGLTPEDDGIYTCECSCPDGTYVTHLNIILEDNDGQFSSRSHQAFILILSLVMIAVSASAAVTAVLLGCILSIKHCRNKTRSEASEPPHSKTFKYQDDPGGLYESLQQPGSDFYQTLSPENHKLDTSTTSWETEDAESKQQMEIYENL